MATAPRTGATGRGDDASTSLHVLVTRRVPDAALAVLRADDRLALDYRDEDAPIARAEFLERLAPCTGALVMLTERIDDETLAAAPALHGVANFAVGHDNFDLAAMTARGVWATNTPDVLTESCADLAWALMLAAARRVVECDGILRRGEWHGWGPLQFLGADIHGRTLGIVGAGRIGIAVARRAAGFRMRVLYTPNSRGDRVPEMERQVPGARCVPLDDLVRETDIISLHCPLTASTRHLFDRARLLAMKPGALLVNTSRGPVVDEAALADVLESGHLGGAALDVFEREPRVEARLLPLPNVVLTPHIASATHATRDAMGTIAARNLVAALRGETPPNALNTPAPR